MQTSVSKKLLSGSFWGLSSKGIDAIAKFVTIPLLIGFFGKADFGLVALAFSLNAYLRLMELGMNIGSIRYFSVWFAQKDTERIQKVSQSSIVAYGILGLVNATVFCVVGVFASKIFNLGADQVHVFKDMMFILAASAIINWTAFVIEQLLTASEEFAWLGKMTIITSVLGFLSAFITVQLQLDLRIYFFLYVISSIAIVPFNIWRLRKTGIAISKLLKPHWHGKAFSEVIRYSLAIFAMGIFQFSADSIRPILLSSFSGKGVEVLTDYRVLQTITLLVLSMGGVFFNMLLPLSSKTYATNDSARTDKIVYQGTKYLTIFLSFIVFGLVINSGYILTMYVGKEYAGLSLWLNVWLITLLLSMHSFPVSSMILSGGRTRPLVWSSAIGCIASIGITIWLAPALNIGAAVLGYLAYVIIHNTFTYCYYIPKVLKLDAKKIFFYYFLPVGLAGAIAAIVASFAGYLFSFRSAHMMMVVRSTVFTLLFVTQVWFFILRSNELKYLRSWTIFSNKKALTS